MNRPDTTIVIPTFRRPLGLRHLLDSLAEQVEPGIDWKVLVIDNDGDGSAARIVNGTQLPVDIRVIVEPRRGASAARNRGVREVNTDLTVLLDDDVIPDRDWLAEVIRPVIEGRCDVTAGRVLLDPSASRPIWMDDLLAGYLTHLDLGPDPRMLTPDEYLLTANMAARTDVLAAVPFDERLGPREGEHLTNDDLDLTRRLMDAGARVAWVPSAVVVHEAPSERLQLSWVLRRAYQQGRSDWLLEEDQMRSRRHLGLGYGVQLLRERWLWRFSNRTSVPSLLAHLGCDLARALGFLREAARGHRRPTRAGATGPDRRTQDGPGPPV